MLRFMSCVMMMLFALPAAANEDFDGFPSRQYPLSSGLILHGWSDEDHPDYRLKKMTDRHYKMDLSIVNDISEITSNKKHRIIKARYRSKQSFSISGEGPTWALTDIQTPFSPWHVLPVADNGQSLSLKTISYFGGNVPGDELTLKEVFPDITPERIYAAERAYRKVHGDGVYPEYLKFCIESLDNQGSSSCGPYVNQVELELMLKDAPPVSITFTYIPGC